MVELIKFIIVRGFVFENSLFLFCLKLILLFIVYFFCFWNERVIFDLFKGRCFLIRLKVDIVLVLEYNW